MSLAAGFIIAMAGIYLMQTRLVGSTSEPRQAVLQAMVTTHEACCACANHAMPGLPAANMRLIGQVVGQQLHEGVLAADLSEDGWEFKGASICKVDGEPSAHFVFARRNARMSVFSLPKSASAQMSETATYTGMVDDHCVAAFVQGGQVYCMVGFCPNRNLKVSEVAGLLQKHRDDLVSASLAALR